MALTETTLEALIFIDKGLISGFNIEDDNFLNAVSLHVKYYHNIEQHIANLRKLLSNEISRKFGYAPEIVEHDKIGIFRWKSYFDFVEDNKYYAVIKRGDLYIAEEISRDVVLNFNDKDRFIIAQDSTKILSFLVDSGEEGAFIYKYLRNYVSKKHLVNGELVHNPNVILTDSHQVPLFVIKDGDDIIQDKSDLVEVANLKFTKKDECLQTLVKINDLRRIFHRFGGFQCEFELKKEIRYVSPELV